MIPFSEFLRNIEAIAAEHPAYKLGEDGDNGLCDCIGLIIGAIRRSGGKWAGVHGTNYTVRNAVEYIDRVSSSADLAVGELVFKAHEPDEAGYDLPSRYAESADKRDYYHVGVVLSVAPLRIVHCTTPNGIKEDTKLGAWKYRAWCSMIAREAQEVNMQTMIVTAQSGTTVNMREKPSLNAPLARKVSVGEAVTVTGESGEWCKVTYGTYTGYIMKEFLTAPGAIGEKTELMTLLLNMREMIDLAIQRAGGE